jgi:hypothetical protein
MTTATVPRVGVDPSPATPPARRSGLPWWLRIVIPLGVVALFWGVTVAAHRYQEPDLTDPGTLSPLGTGRHGSSQLAELLRARGITIERVTSTGAAVEAARNRDATILVPAPNLLNGRLVTDLRNVPGEHRVVMVRPGQVSVVMSGLATAVTATRWTTAIVEPECASPEAREAGPAAVYRNRYAGAELAIRCYRGSLVGDRVGDVEVLLVGATDPFRNDRIGEAGNAALATGLLARHGVVIWIDVHAPEPRPRPPLPEIRLPDYERGELDRTNTGHPLVDAFPVQLWVVAALLLGAGGLLALAAARRLGPPVPEPLPVVVPAAEAVTGRGRLYRRARAHPASLATLRAGAVARLARAVDPFARAPDHGLEVPGPRRDAFIRAIAARSGLPDQTVATVLFGPLPTDDEGLLAAVADLDRLVAAVLQPPGTRSESVAQNRTPEPGGSP